MGENIFLGATFQTDGTGTNEGAEKKHKTAKSLRVLIYFIFVSYHDSFIFEHEKMIPYMSNEKEATVAGHAGCFGLETVFLKYCRRSAQCRQMWSATLGPIMISSYFT